jgi:hypothetical protein
MTIWLLREGGEALGATLLGLAGVPNVCTYDSQNVFSPFVFWGMWVERDGGGWELPTLDLAGVPNVCTYAFQNVFLWFQMMFL